MTPDSLRFKLLEFYGTRVKHRGQHRIHAFLRTGLNANIDADLEVVRDGHRWLLNPADFSQSEFFWLGQRDAWDTKHAKELIRAGDTVFDVGANFGYYAITFAAALGRDCEIHAFEPFPSNMIRLRKNIRMNGLDHVIHAHAIALADHEGVGTMMTWDDNSGASTLALAPGAAVAAKDIELTTLDAFCEQRAITRLDFVKIDVEGFETRLIAGGARTIERFAPAMMIEFHPPNLLRAGTSVDHLAALLADLNYKLWVAQRGRLVPLHDLPRSEDYVNVFCIPAKSLS